ncbi:hypothetical protein COZ45_01115, partial [Candidatus Uhrbacteria bacterium CG_4_10_14_3_um_filter_41_21]
LNINGDQYTGACLTWFPVDQIAGATDLYAKYTEAGFVEDAYYCSEIQVYSNQGTFKGKLNDNESATYTHALYAGCENFITCPDDYWAIAGLELNLDNNCDASYLCVPIDSFHTSDSSYTAGSDVGEECVVSDLSTSYTEGTSLAGNTVYLYGEADISNYTDSVNKFDDCVRFGASAVNISSFSESESFDSPYIWVNYQAEMTYRDGSKEAIGDTYSYLKYPACNALVQVSSSDAAFASAPWTDRLFGSASESYSVDVGDLSYTANTLNFPFGASVSPDSSDGLSYFFQKVLGGLGAIDWLMPAIVPSCIDGVTLYPTDDASSDPTTCASYEAGFGNEKDTVQARSYVNWTKITSAGIYVSDSVEDVVGRINNLFANIIGDFSWSFGSGDFEVGSYGDYDGAYADDYDAADVRATEGTPPTVWAVDTENCGSRYCA